MTFGESLSVHSLKLVPRLGRSRSVCETDAGSEVVVQSLESSDGVDGDHNVPIALWNTRILVSDKLQSKLFG